MVLTLYYSFDRIPSDSVWTNKQTETWGYPNWTKFHKTKSSGCVSQFISYQTDIINRKGCYFHKGLSYLKIKETTIQYYYDSTTIIFNYINFSLNSILLSTNINSAHQKTLLQSYIIMYMYVLTLYNIFTSYKYSLYFCLPLHHG